MAHQAPTLTQASLLIRSESASATTTYCEQSVHPGVRKALLLVEENVYQTTLNLSLPSTSASSSILGTETTETTTSLLASSFMVSSETPVNHQQHNNHNHNKFSLWNSSAAESSNLLTVPTARAIVDCLQRNRRIQRLVLDAQQWFPTSVQEESTSLQVLCDFFAATTASEHKLCSITLVGSRQPRNRSSSDHQQSPEPQHSSAIASRSGGIQCNSNMMESFVAALAKSPIQQIRFAQVNFATDPTLTALGQALLVGKHKQEVVTSLQFHSCSFRGSQLWRPILDPTVTARLQSSSTASSIQDLQWFDCRDWKDASAAHVLRALTKNKFSLRRLGLTWNPLLHHQTLSALVHDVIPQMTQLQSLQLEHNPRLFVPPQQHQVTIAVSGGTSVQNTAAASPARQFLTAVRRRNCSLQHIQVNHNQPARSESSSATQQQQQHIHPPHPAHHQHDQEDADEDKGSSSARTISSVPLRDDSPVFQSALQQCRERNRWNTRVRKLLLGQPAKMKVAQGAHQARQAPPTTDLALWGKALATLVSVATPPSSSSSNLASEEPQAAQEEAPASPIVCYGDNPNVGSRHNHEMMHTTVSATFMTVSALSPLLVASVRSEPTNC
mmetsp:Transcript_114/g.243  ORF Transcript_114/g.243 Transcript_114/m.243 type:complete len:613 (-) Transcript_114:153-1991(-)|eukprot:CAMPEP_0168740954 /NCGR_PEP_ID=MMETSP0724-20121128/12253_1 /TAXON_ID=265536 /ORGANISM="Amphiprora sp., Strain CCMP467" /LENGTH=612 /DNA_ID=CAMNT_0008788421 /DNA_START=179 /DNA_END=2017 /DNA_ORIENTATION=-